MLLLFWNGVSLEAPVLLTELDGTGPPAVPEVSIDEERLLVVEENCSILQRTRVSISDVSGPTLRPVLQSRRVVTENLSTGVQFCHIPLLTRLLC